MSDWVKFHAELRQGDKRGLPRATRFVFLELCQVSRKTHGILRLPLGMSDVDALHDVLGGSRKEIVAALPDLVAQPADPDESPMIVLEGQEKSRTLRIPSWLQWNSVDKSTERVQKMRGIRKATQDGDRVYFLRSEQRGEIKIGYSDNVVDRTTNIGIELGEKLELLGTIAGGLDVEQGLHRQFAALRTRGEWFRETPELLSFIDRVTEQETKRVTRPGNRAAPLDQRRGEEITAHTPREGSSGGTDPVARELLDELRAHPALTSVTTLRFAETLAGRASSGAKRISDVRVAIGEAARDVGAAEATGGGLTAETIAKTVARYCDHAKPPREDRRPFASVTPIPTPSRSYKTPTELAAEADSGPPPAPRRGAIQ